MTNDAKDYYKGGRRVFIGGVPCRVRADAVSDTAMKLLRQNPTLSGPFKYAQKKGIWVD